MGRNFGHMNQYSKRLEFGISPYEISIFPKKGLFDPIPNTIRRFWRSAWLILPFGGTYYGIKWMLAYNKKHVLRKNPADYANDE